jgi:hypothetical protein
MFCKPPSAAPLGFANLYERNKDPSFFPESVRFSICPHNGKNN